MDRGEPRPPRSHRRGPPVGLGRSCLHSDLVTVRAGVTRVTTFGRDHGIGRIARAAAAATVALLTAAGPVTARPVTGEVARGPVGASTGVGAASASATSGCQATRTLGHSRKGTRIVACQITGSDPSNGRRLLVVGSMHGDEQAGMRVTKLLRSRDLGGLGVDVWVIATINPDGTKADRRGNARRIDLNGNFPTSGWKVRMPGTSYWGGSKAASEPETRALMKAMRTIRPVEVVVFHQHANVIDCPPYRSSDLTRRLHELTGYKIRCMPVLAGNFTAWANQTYDWTTTVTFELEARPSTKRLGRVADGLVTAATQQPGG